MILSISEYGEMEESELTNEKAALKANLVRIRIEGNDNVAIEKQLPLEMSIRAFVFLAQRLFHTGSAKLLLTLISSKVIIKIITCLINFFCFIF